MKKLNLSKLEHNIMKNTDSDLAECNIGAASLAVTQSGETVFKGHFGTQTQLDGGALGDETLFRLASMTKPVVSVAVGVLFDEKKLSLDDEIEKYIPCFKDLEIKTLDENGERITLGRVQTKPTLLHLLTHSSGIGSDAVSDYNLARMTPEQLATLESSMPVYAEGGAAFEPFTRQSYSPLEGLDIAARIVEIVSDLPFDEFMKKHICDKCEMKDMTFAPTPEQWSRMIQMHKKLDGKNAVASAPTDAVFSDKFPITHFSGGGGLASTMADYMNFAAMLLNKGVFGGQRVISEEYLSLMSSPRLPESVMGGDNVWGLGVRVVCGRGYKRLPVGSFGWSGAFGTHFWVDPANEITAVYMKNSLYDGGAGAVTAAEFEKAVTGALKMF